MKLKWKILSVGVLLVLACLYSVQWNRINHKYPPTQVVSYTRAQGAAYNGFQIKVKNTTFLNDAELKKNHKDFYDLIYTEDAETKAIIVDIQVTNNNKQEAEINISDAWLQSNYWVNGIAMTGFAAINPLGASLHPSLKPGETITLRLPFTMIPEHFKEKDWNNISRRKYDLVLSCYPVKRMLQIN